MKKKEKRRCEEAKTSNRLPIYGVKLPSNKEGELEFISHKILKYKLSGAQISRRQYLKIIKVLKDFNILSYSTKGIKFYKILKE